MTVVFTGDWSRFLDTISPDRAAVRMRRIFERAGKVLGMKFISMVKRSVNPERRYAENAPRTIRDKGHDIPLVGASPTRGLLMKSLTYFQPHAFEVWVGVPSGHERSPIANILHFGGETPQGGTIPKREFITEILNDQTFQRFFARTLWRAWAQVFGLTA